MEKDKMLVDGAEVKNPLVIALKKPVKFEANEIAEINLSGLEDLTCGDLIKIGKDFAKIRGEDYSPIAAMVPESDLEYDFFVASRVSGLPMEFFTKLSSKESGRIKGKIVGFFYSEV